MKMQANSEHHSLATMPLDVLECVQQELSRVDKERLILSIAGEYRRHGGRDGTNERWLSVKESLAEEEEERREAAERHQLIRQCARLKKAYAEWLSPRKRGDNSPPGYRFLARKHHVYPVRLHRTLQTDLYVLFLKMSVLMRKNLTLTRIVIIIMFNGGSGGIAL